MRDGALGLRDPGVHRLEGQGQNEGQTGAQALGGPALQICQRAIPHLVLDGVLALGFMIMTLRYASAWLGLVMVLQGVQFSLHAFYFVTQKTPGLAYAVVNNLVTWGTLLGILWGVLAHWRQQRRSAV
jgi:uncharacterized membrane protein HdeD (DUF308 family)